MKRFDDSAVSPVVGVMLMLVVTIIIAAVVSAFAGGLATDQGKAPQATLSCTPAIVSIQDTVKTNYTADYPAGFVADNGLLFEHKGGEGFALKDIAIQIQDGTTKGTISLANTMPLVNCTSSAVTAYIMEIGSDDGFITPGDKFMLYADGCYDASEVGGGYAQEPCISWKPVDALSGISLIKNKISEYKIIHKPSGNVIQQGTVVLR